MIYENNICEGGIEMSGKQKRISKLIDVMKTKINQLENGYINDKNLEELIEKMNNQTFYQLQK